MALNYFSPNKIFHGIPLDKRDGTALGEPGVFSEHTYLSSAVLAAGTPRGVDCSLYYGSSVGTVTARDTTGRLGDASLRQEGGLSEE